MTMIRPTVRGVYRRQTDLSSLRNSKPYSQPRRGPGELARGVCALAMRGSIACEDRNEWDPACTLWSRQYTIAWPSNLAETDSDVLLLDQYALYLSAVISRVVPMGLDTGIPRTSEKGHAYRRGGSHDDATSEHLRAHAHRDSG